MSSGSLSLLVRMLVGETHPVVANMEIDGYGRVGFGVYNAKTLFGDREFLEILYERHYDIFDAVIKYLIDLSPMEQGPYYGNGVIRPFAAVRDFFPEAYDFIVNHFKGILPNIQDISGLQLG